MTDPDPDFAAVRDALDRVEARLELVARWVDSEAEAGLDVPMPVRHALGLIAEDD